MKTIISVIKPTLIIFLIVNLFFWMIYHSSGHKIPLETDLTFGFVSLFFVLIIFFLHLKKF